MLLATPCEFSRGSGNASVLLAGCSGNRGLTASLVFGNGWLLHDEVCFVIYGANAGESLFPIADEAFHYLRLNNNKNLNDQPENKKLKSYL